jgi:hypothetical protein
MWVGIAFAEPLPERMETHWRLASSIEVEMIRGNLDVVRAMAGRLAALPTDGFGPELEAPLERLRTVAADLSAVEDMELAARGVSHLATACGECHTQLSGGPPARPKSWPPANADEAAEMTAHQAAADWLWIGLVAPSDSAWLKGARALRREPPDDRVGEVATRLEQAKGAARTTVYAELLHACSSCHGRR